MSEGDASASSVVDAPDTGAMPSVAAPPTPGISTSAANTEPPPPPVPSPPSAPDIPVEDLLPEPEIEPPSPEPTPAPPVSPEASQPAPAAEAPQSVAPAPAKAITSYLSAAIEKMRFKKRARLDKVVVLARKNGRITNNDVETLLRVSDATASRYLAQLVREGRLARSGTTGSTFYTAH